MTLRRLPMTADILNARFADYSLLDVGCRTMALRPMLTGCRAYTGTDIIAGEGILQGDLERGIAAPDKSYDVVVALDVLEHLDRCHHALAEVLRVARQCAVISLPNMFFWTFRLNFLRGRGISGKYAFPRQPVIDRHKWIMSYDEAVAFVRANADGYDIEIMPIRPERGKLRAIRESLDGLLGAVWPNLFNYGVLVILTPKA